MRHGDAVCGYQGGERGMESRWTGGRRHRVRVVKFSFLFAIALAGGLVAAGVVSGAGPLAVISTASTTDEHSCHHSIAAVSDGPCVEAIPHRCGHADAPTIGS